MNQTAFLFLLMLGGLSSTYGQLEEESVEQNALFHVPEVATAFKALDSWIDATLQSQDDVGLSIGVVYDQDLIWAKGYGFADLTNKIPADGRTRYRIASCTKLFTATAIMQLRDAGKLRLNDPVAKYLSWFNIRSTHPEGPEITIQHLLTHTAGLPREAAGTDWYELNLPSRQEMVQGISEQETVFPAETEWKYSNLGLSLAGEIVSVVSGESWEQYIEQHILTPLNMTNSTPAPSPDTLWLSVGYDHRDPGESRSVKPFFDGRGTRPAGNIASCVDDMAKFVSLQFRTEDSDDNQILKASSLREMHRPHWLHPNWQSAWGLGFSIRRVGNETRVGHSGRLPGYSSTLELILEKKIGVIVLMNQDGGSPELYRDKAFQLVTAPISRATKPSKPIPKPSPQWEQYLGSYGRKRTDVQITILDGKLTMIFPGRDNPWEPQVTLEPVSERRFKAVPEQRSFHPTTLNGEVLTFDLDEKGRVIGFGNPSFYWPRR